MHCLYSVDNVIFFLACKIHSPHYHNVTVPKDSFRVTKNIHHRNILLLIAGLWTDFLPRHKYCTQRVLLDDLTVIANV